MFPPEWTPAVPDLPVTDATTHQQSVVAADGSTTVEDATLVPSPLSGIHPDNHGSLAESVAQGSAADLAIPALDLELFKVSP